MEKTDNLEFEGISYGTETLHGYCVNTVTVQTERAAERLQKEVGSYITVEIGKAFYSGRNIASLCKCMAEVLKRVLEPHFHGKLLICGIGNPSIPADSLGPAVTESLHLLDLAQDEGSNGKRFRDVCSIAQGDPRNGNIGTKELFEAVARGLKADCLLLIDSMATDRPDRLFQTIELSTAGGLKIVAENNKADWTSIGLPIITVGVPTVIASQKLFGGSEPIDDQITSMRAKAMVSCAAAILDYAIVKVGWPALPDDSPIITNILQNLFPN